MSSLSKSKELIISTKAKEKLPVKYNESSVLDLVDNEIFLENRNEVKNITRNTRQSISKNLDR